MKLRLIAAFMGLLWMGTASATIIDGLTYKLKDHPDGALAATAPYGLRSDHLGILFSATDVSVTADYGASTATIVGTLTAHPGGATWGVRNDFSGLVVDATPGMGWRATAGTLELWAPGSAMGVDPATHTFANKANGDGWAALFLMDNHRCTGHLLCGPNVLRAWVDLPGTNDWLVQNGPPDLVPEPLPVALFGLGLLALGARRVRMA